MGRNTWPGPWRAAGASLSKSLLLAWHLWISASTGTEPAARGSHRTSQMQPEGPSGCDHEILRDPRVGVYYLRKLVPWSPGTEGALWDALNPGLI